MGLDLVEGQKLYFVYSERRRGAPREVVITKVGRKWAQTDYQYRIDVETLRADGKGFVSPGRCYLSRAEYDAEVALNSAWSKLQGKLRQQYSPPKNITLTEIQKVESILFDRARTAQESQ